MKKFLLIAAMLMLTACSPDEQSKQHTEAADQFKTAQSAMDAALGGYINDEKFPDQLAVDAFDTFREQKLQEAAAIFEKLLTKGDPEQQLACATSLAEIRAFQATVATNNAMNAGNALLGKGNKLLATVTATSNADTMYKAMTTGKAQKVRDALAQRSVALKQQLDIAQSKINMLDRQLNDLLTDKAEGEQQRVALMDKSAKISTTLGSLTGEERYRMATQAIQLRKQADERTAEIETLAGQIDLKRGELKDARDAHAKLESRLTGVNETKKTLEMHLQQRGNVATAASGMTNEYTGSLTGALNELTGNYNTRVIEPVEQAIKQMTQAIDVLSKAPRSSNFDRMHTDFNLAAKQAGLAHIQHLLATSLHDYQQLLELITGMTSESIAPAKLTIIGEAAKMATERIEALGADRTENLTKASELFLAAADQADLQEMQAACYQQLVSVNRMLLETTGDTQWQQKVQQFQQKLDTLVVEDAA